MREDAILPLESVVVLVPSLPVVRVVVQAGWPSQIAVLCDAQLTVANSLIE